ncbi:MAG: MFS transporter [Chitinophagaceae bacterium]|nr:MFS transporter [Chitinophagaceae bacterium]
MKRAFALYKSAYGGLAPATWWLSLVILVNRSGTMVVPFMTLYLTENKQVSITKAGLVMALFGAGAVVGGFLGGQLTDRLGFYYIQLAALAGGGVMFFVVGQMNSYPAICMATFVLSLINESFRPANSAAIAHYSSEHNRTRSYSLNRLAVNLGWSLGGALGGFIAAYNYQLLFIIDGCTNIVAAFLLWLFLSPSKNKSTPSGSHQREQGFVRSAYRDKPYLIFIFLTILFAYCFFQVFSTLPVFYKKELYLSEQFIGALMALNGLMITFIEMVMVFKLDGRRHNLHYIFYGVLLTGVSYSMFNLSITPVLLAITAMVLVTVGEMLSMPFMNSYWTSRSQVLNRGQYAGLYTSAWSVAQVLAPATGAILAEVYGFRFLWWFIGALCLVTAVGFKMLQRYEKNTTSQLTPGGSI